MNSQPVPETLYELVYTSVARKGVGVAELEHILVTARQRNIEAGVTGLLLFSRGEFVQLLEGLQKDVERIYNDFIALDQKHGAPAIAWTQNIAQRNFAEWSMGFSRCKGLAATTPGLEGYLAGGLASLDMSGPASTGRKLLLAIYAQISPRA
jgi:hypothetical protein